MSLVDVLKQQITEIFQDWWNKRDMMNLDHLKAEADRIEKDVLGLVDTAFKNYVCITRSSEKAIREMEKIYEKADDVVVLERKKLQDLYKHGEDALKFHKETTKSERNICFWRGWNTALKRLGVVEEKTP